MKLKFWEKKPKFTAAEMGDVLCQEMIVNLQRNVSEKKVEPKPEERSGFIREVSHKHLTTRGRR